MNDAQKQVVATLAAAMITSRGVPTTPREAATLYSDLAMTLYAAFYANHSGMKAFQASGRIDQAFNEGTWGSPD